jgi:hypothetical protein
MQMSHNNGISQPAIVDYPNQPNPHFVHISSTKNALLRLSFIISSVKMQGKTGNLRG